MSNKTNNNWQNEGKVLNFAIGRIPGKYLGTYLMLVRYALGFGSVFTEHKPRSYFASKLHMTQKSFTTHIQWLVDNKFIKIKTHSQFIEGGGSFPNAYRIVLYKDMGYLSFGENKEEEEKPIEDCPMGW